MSTQIQIPLALSPVPQKSQLSPQIHLDKDSKPNFTMEGDNSAVPVMTEITTMDATFESSMMETPKASLSTIQESAATTIQSHWRGYKAREKDPQIIQVRNEMRTKRAEDHIQCLQNQLVKCIQMVDEEKKMRQLQNEALKILWNERNLSRNDDADSVIPVKYNGHEARELTEEEIQKLEKDKRVVAEFKQNKLEQEAQKNWDLFYKRNTTKFFKDRHWTTREFEELGISVDDEENKKTVLEVGCGVGNFIFPLLEEHPGLFFYGCDFSPRAVEFVKENPKYDEDRCKAFYCDLTKNDLTDNIPEDTVDIVTMIFVLSAIHPDKMVDALRNVYRVLKPGGCVLFRDYGLYDHAMLRFAPGHKLSEGFYVRQDGTRAYYFTKENLNSLFEESGFEVIKNEYIKRETVNKKEGLCVPRIFLQGKFQRPITENDSDHSLEY